MKSRQRIPLSIGLGAALLLGGCNLFQPRVPLRPALGDIVADYSTAAATLETMARAIEAKAAGNSPSAYVGGLADSIRAGDDQTFIAYFDPAVVTASGRTPPSEPWGPDREKQVFIHLPELSENSYSFAWLEEVGAIKFLYLCHQSIVCFFGHIDYVRATFHDADFVT